MTKEAQVIALWELLRAYGIETMEQFMEAYKNCPKIDITPFVPMSLKPPEKL